MYPHETVKALKALLIPNSVLRCIKYNFKNSCEIYAIPKQIVLFNRSKTSFGDSVRSCHTKYLTNDIEENVIDNIHGEIHHGINICSDGEMREQLNSNMEFSNEKKVGISPGLLKIVIFFYQTNVLFKIYARSKPSGISLVLEEHCQLCSVFELMRLFHRIYLGVHLVTYSLPGKFLSRHPSSLFHLPWYS